MSLSQKSLLSAGAALIALMGVAVTTVTGIQATTANSVSNQQAPRLIASKLRNLTIVFPSRADSTDLQSKANAVATFLTKEMGIPVKAQIGDDTAAVEALRANRAEVAFLSSRPALKAEELANARLYLAEVRDNYSGRFTYDSIFVVRNNSPLRSGSNAKTTLEQLRGRRMAFTSPTSGSGFIFPVSELVKQGFVRYIKLTQTYLFRLFYNR